MAAIVCVHVATRDRPILLAVRDAPQDPADSGWQFLCSLDNTNDVDSAQVWLVEEVLALDPTLSKWIDSPIGTTLKRINNEGSWEPALKSSRD